MTFEFATAGRILFGTGVADQAAGLAAAHGRRVLLVHGRNPARSQPLRQSLESLGLEVHTMGVAGEPGTDWAQSAVARLRSAGCEVVVACGGGSALDAGKALAALLANPGDVYDYLEVVGRGRPLTVPALPVIAVPTTAGTGSEVTRNAVLTDPERKVKASLRHPSMLPRVALVDPLLTTGLPPALTAGTGLDALAQLIEPYVSTRANPLTDCFCEEGIRRVARSLTRAVRDGSDLEARTDLSLAALLSGLALANAGLGAVHGLAAPLGGVLAAPHGQLCAALLPEVMAVNLEVLAARLPASPALGRYLEIARLLTGSHVASAADGVSWLRELAAELDIPGLSRWGLTPDSIPEIVEQAGRASSMRSNPVPLTPEELAVILQRAS
ncbi:MAG: iron-containing alcohol dehydrogenase [Acidobacteriota bacterium]